jgi:hypothetical protein
VRVLVKLFGKNSPFYPRQPFSCINDLFIAVFVRKLVPLLEFCDKFAVNFQYLLMPGSCEERRLFAVIHGEQIDIIGAFFVLFTV